jgi:hypothetical protein
MILWEYEIGLPLQAFIHAYSMDLIFHIPTHREILLGHEPSISRVT